VAATLGEIEAIYRERYSTFLRVAVGVTGEEQSAADAVHDAFVRAVRYRRRFRGESSLEGWLWRIVVNEARRRCERTPTTAELPVLPAAAESNGSHDDVRALLTALPERQRTVLFLRYFADLDYQAIAGVLEIAPGTVAATLHAAHAALRKQLEEVPR
jgi:RNA polymerase sigma-70 factor (ECF subfamily)